jgi:hypothetical protein
MRFIKKQLSLWRIVLIIGAALIAILIAARVRVATKAQVNEQEDYWARRVERRLDRRQEYLDRQTGDDNDDADAKDSKDSKDTADDEDDADDTVDKDVKAQQDIYERRREYWRQRVEKEW